MNRTTQLSESHSSRHQNELFEGGIGGVDEAGRGPLAGPVVAAVVVLLAGQRIEGVCDSKQIPAARRSSLAAQIKAEAAAWHIGVASPREIDRINILQATMLAMQRAIAGLARLPVLIRIDGNRAPDLPGYRGVLETLVRGDSLCGAISAASILAKVHRDGKMIELDRQYPQYGFAHHKGYPTRQHRAALSTFGPCPEHRRSFRPVRIAESTE